MRDFERPSGPTRRLVIGAGLAGASLLAGRQAWAQSARLPDLEETLELLDSEAGVRLMYVRFSLALSLTLDLMVRLLGADTGEPGPARELLVLAAERPATDEMFAVLSDLVNGELRESIRLTLMEIPDPLEEERGAAVGALLERVAAGLEEFGLPREAPPVADALSACGHVERIAAVTRDTPVHRSFICGKYPFSFFC